MSATQGPYTRDTPGPALQAVLEALSDAERGALERHLYADTSADWLADTLASHGHAVSATTIRKHRRNRRRDRSVSV